MSDYQVIKLSNGENLICDVISDSDTTLNVKSPLKMETLSKFTKSGVVESLSLVRWMQPYCDDKQFALSKNNVIFIRIYRIGEQTYNHQIMNIIW